MKKLLYLLLFLGIVSSCQKENLESQNILTTELVNRSNLDANDTQEEGLLGCCDWVDISYVSLGSPTNSSICVYEITVVNDGPCDLYVYSGFTQLNITIPSGTTLTFNINVNPSNGLFTRIAIGNTLYEACEVLDLPAVCPEDCCESGDISINSIISHGQIQPGPCRYTVNITNNSECDVFVFDPQGNIVGTIPANSTVDVMIGVPPGGKTIPPVPPVLFTVGETAATACGNFVLSRYCQIVG